MTEIAFPIPDGSPLGGPYSVEDLHTILHFLTANSTGVYRGYADEMEPQIAGPTVLVKTGGANIDGICVYITEQEFVEPEAIPEVGDTGMLAALVVEWDTPTTGAIDVRLEIISSTDGSTTIPTPADTYGTKIELPLASFTMDTAGTIDEESFTDAREYVSFPDVDTLDSGALKAWSAMEADGTPSLRTPTENVTGIANESTAGELTQVDVSFGSTDIAYVLVDGTHRGIATSWVDADTVTLQFKDVGGYGVQFVGGDTMIYGFTRLLDDGDAV